MLSYIANTNLARTIETICKKKNILILNSQEIETDIRQYIKETKVNFNLSKYLIIDISLLTNSDSEIIESIFNFSKLYTKTRIVILASNMDSQNPVLTNLFDLGFYNIINESDSKKIETKLNIALSENGITKNESKKFKKKEEQVTKENKFKTAINKINIKKKLKESKKTNKGDNLDMPTHSVYLFSLLLEAVTRLVKFICYVLVFSLTSVGLTILLNSELREMVFQIFGLK